eukprot:TRINITY_DN10949_c0_g1_i1.p1 TRINITY_DN10949_c0_g1~~TRINITY_DN10949_c0_g1_i1.p1  ORF type:complete len:276 (-),score=131.64 TRINITY_DN10949_c0_g1_i1:41-868(-)
MIQANDVGVKTKIKGGEIMRRNLMLKIYGIEVKKERGGETVRGNIKKRNEVIESTWGDKYKFYVDQNNECKMEIIELNKLKMKLTWTGSVLIVDEGEGAISSNDVVMKFNGVNLVVENSKGKILNVYQWRKTRKEWKEIGENKQNLKKKWRWENEREMKEMKENSGGEGGIWSLREERSGDWVVPVLMGLEALRAMKEEGNAEQLEEEGEREKRRELKEDEKEQERILEEMRKEIEKNPNKDPLHLQEILRSFQDESLQSLTPRSKEIAERNKKL